MAENVPILHLIVLVSGDGVHTLQLIIYSSWLITPLIVCSDLSACEVHDWNSHLCLDIWRILCSETLILTCCQLPTSVSLRDAHHWVWGGWRYAVMLTLWGAQSWSGEPSLMRLFGCLTASRFGPCKQSSQVFMCKFFNHRHSSRNNNATQPWPAVLIPSIFLLLFSY